VTRKQMSDQVARWLGLQDDTTYPETSMIWDQLYYGTIDLLARTRCVVRCVDLRTRTGQDEYTLDHSILGLVDVENGARPRARRNETLSPSFTLIRSDVLIIQPTPTADGQIQVWGVLRPQQMQGDTDSPGDESYGAIPDEYQDAIVTFAMWKLADYADDASASNGDYYRTLYEGQDGRGGRLAQIKAAVNKRGTAKAAGRYVNLRPVSSSGAYVG
jgi:hypothetical protein